MIDSKRYIREVKSWLPCRKKMKKQIMMQIEHDLFLYLTEQPDADYADIVARFGTPHQIAVAYVNEQDTAQLLNDLRIKRKVVCVISAAFVLIVMIWSLAMGMLYVEGHKNINGNINDMGIEVVSEEDYPD